MKASVNFNSQLSGEIAIINGVKPGDIPALTLFSIFFAVHLTYAFKDCDQGIPLPLRTLAKMFNLRRFNTKSEKFVELIGELLYVDDTVFLAHRQTDIQHIRDHFS